ARGLQRARRARGHRRSLAGRDSARGVLLGDDDRRADPLVGPRARHRRRRRAGSGDRRARVRTHAADGGPPAADRPLRTAGPGSRRRAAAGKASRDFRSRCVAWRAGAKGRRTRVLFDATPVPDEHDREEVTLVARGIATAVAPETGLTDIQADLLEA